MDNYSVSINIAARRLNLLKNGVVMKGYPIAVGKPSTPTPKGTFRTINKAINPGGPFGVLWFGLNAPGGSYGIHGTNNPSSIGKNVSNGCIRMHNKDITDLAKYITVGTVVQIS